MRSTTQATDEWVLNGTKAWIANGGIADVHVVVAAVEPDPRAVATPASSCPRHEGISLGQKYKKHGIRASLTAVDQHRGEIGGRPGDLQ